ncbi:nitroreductase [Halobacteriales archaeon QS_1_68_20]|nr:MAG: nitroreductase [Halobacteriales archaeon QS_1_68_20]
MDVDSSSLHALRSQLYNPVDTPIAHEELDLFRKKEFGDADVAELFHENTKITLNDARFARRVHKFNNDETSWTVLEHFRPDYENREPVELPDPAESLSTDLSTALSQRESVRVFEGGELSRQQLSTLLWYSSGTPRTQVLSGEADHPVERRPYPSGGGLYPVELYFALTSAGEGLSEGLYYYVPGEHELRRLRRPASAGDFLEELTGLLDPHDETAIDFEGANFVPMLTAAFWRSKAKYGPRGYRFVLQESGHLLQNLLLVAEALGMGGVPLGAYREDEINEFLGVDGVNEALVYAGVFGTTGGNA